MPTILPVGFRRLLGSFSYAVDGVELAYQRLRETALTYELPAANAHVSCANWTARGRLSLVVDAWSLIEHVSRARKLTSRIPWSSDSPGADLNSFIRETKPAAHIRAKLNYLDENGGGAGEHLDQQSIFGTVDWIDTRTVGGVTRYAISTGSGAEAERLLSTIPALPDVGGDVAEFRLTVAGQQADLDRLRDAVTLFRSLLESSITRSVRDAVVAEAKNRKTLVSGLCASSITDMTGAARFEQGSSDIKRLSPAFRRVSVEVPRDAFEILQ